MEVDEKGIWRVIARVALVVGLIAGLNAIIGFFRGGAAPGGSTGETQIGSSATHTPGNAADSTSTVPVSAASPSATTAPVHSGTIFCQAGGAAGWNGWEIAGSWHLLSGNLVNDGSDAGSNLAPNLSVPDTCQPTISDYAVTASVKIDQISSSGASYGIDVRGVTGTGGWQGYAGYLYPSSDASGVHADFTLSSVGVGSQDIGTAYNRGFDQGWHALQVSVRGNSVT